MSRPSLEDLLLEYRRDGDPQALAELFDRSAPELYRVARYLACGEIDTEDLVQTTYLVALERIGTFRTDGRVVPWLLGILANKARHLRRNIAQQAPAGVPAQAATADPGAGAEARELRHHLEQQLEKMSPVLRPVLVLHLLHSLSAGEIARALDRPAGTVRSQICRGMDTLRRTLPPGLRGAGAVGALPLGIRPQEALSRIRDAVLSRETAATILTATPGILVKTKVLSSLALALAVASAFTFIWKPQQPDLPDGMGKVPAVTAAATQASGTAAQSGIVERRPVVQPATSALEARVRDELVVHVVHAGTGQPAAGAEVLCYLGGTPPEPGTLIVERRDDSWEGRLRESGRSAVADDDGWARVPTRGATVYGVCGVLPDHFGYRDVPEDWRLTGAVVVLTLETDRSVTVQAVAHDGAPLLHVPIGVRRNPEDQFPPDYVGVSKAPDGTLVIPHVQTLSFAQDASGRRTFEVVPFIHGDLDDGVVVDLDTPPEEPVEVRFPPMGNLRAVMLDSSGQKLPPGTALAGFPAPGGNRGLWIRCLTRRSGFPTSLPGVTYPATDDGTYLVPFLEVGHRFVLTGVAGGIEADGPARPGETVEVVLRPTPRVTFSGRLLLPDGTPAASRPFEIHLAYTEREQSRTDAGGRFAVAMQPYPNAVRLEQAPVLVTTGASDYEPSSDRPLYFTRTIPAPELGQTMDLGDALLEPMPLLAAGRVTGELPLRDLSVSAPGPRAWQGGPIGYQPRPRTYWPAEDHFELYGWTDRDEPRLDVDARWHRRARIPFEPGSRDMLIKLSVDHQINASVITAAHRSWNVVRARLVPESPNPSDPPPELEGIASFPDGGLKTFRFDELDPGSYRFEVYANADLRHPVHIVEHVVIGPERTSLDSRLDRIDLRDSVRYFDLELLDPDGVPLDHAWIHVGLEPGSEHLGWSIRNNPVTLAAPGSSVNVLVMANGHRAEAVLGLNEDRTLRLRPALEVYVRLTGEVPQLAEGVQILAYWQLDPASLPVAALRPAVATWSADESSFQGGMPFGPAGNAVALLPSPGRYRVTLVLRDRRLGDLGELTEVPVLLTVTDASDQAFEIAFSPARLQRALRAR